MTDTVGADVVAGALQYLSEEFSVTRQEWRQRFKGGDMLLDGLVSHGYVNEGGGRFAVSEAGRRRISA